MNFYMASLVIFSLFLFGSNVVFSDENSAADSRHFYRVADSNNGIFSSGFSTKDINKLLGKFESSFEEGDIRKFVDLFEKNVKTEDGNSREILEKEYAALFLKTDRRAIKFKNAIWKEDKNGTIWGDIDFVLNIRNRIDKKMSQFSGTMRIYFKKKEKTLAIDGFFHAYDERTTDKNNRAEVDS